LSGQNILIMKKLILIAVVIAGFLFGVWSTSYPVRTVVAVHPGDEQGVERNENEATRALEAMQWYNNQRAYPTGTIPVDWRQRAMAHIRKFNFAKVFSNAATLSWISVGPNNLGGRVRSIVINPLNPTTVYCGSVSGGIWKTTNGGGYWYPVGDAASNLVIGALAIDPVDTNTIYAGTGEGYANVDALRGIGVLKSTDGGSTWNTLDWASFQNLTSATSIYVNKLIIQPDHRTTIFAAMSGDIVSGGVWKTTNGGGNWSQLNIASFSHYCVDLVMDPTNSNILYASFGLTATDGIYKTTNGGSNWVKLTNGFPPASQKFTRISLAISYSSPQTLYASVADSLYGTHSIQKTTNGGASWFTAALRQPYDTLLGQTHLGSQGWYDNVIAVHPSNPNIVFAGGNDMFISTNGGVNWRMLTYGYSNPSYQFMHVDQHAIAFDPTNSSIIYFGNDGGMYKTVDGGSIVFDVNNNLAITQFYSGAVDPTSEIYYGGSQDIGIMKSGNLPAWSIPFSGDAGATNVDFSTPTTVYSEYVYLDVLKSTNSGVNWVRMMNGIPPQGPNLSDGSSERCDFIAPIVMDPTNSQHLIAGTYKVYTTTNGGSFWSSTVTDLSGDGPGSQGSIGGVVSALAISKSSPSTWYAGTGFIYTGYGSGSGPTTTKVWVTTNSGTRWDTISKAPLPNRYVRAIAIDPTNANRAFVCYSGYGTGHVFRTTNRGLSWSDVSSNLPDIPANAIVIDPANTAHCIVGTDVGIFESFDDAADWIQQNNGLADVAVIDLDLRGDQYLFATTHGRGMFKSNGPISTPVSPHLTLSIHQNPILTPYIDVYLLSDTATIPTTASMNLLIAPSTNDSIPLAQQSSSQIFKGSYQFKTSGTAILTASVDDSGGNPMITQRLFQVKLLKQGIAQSMQSPDGVATIVVDENTLPADMYFMIIPEAASPSDSLVIGNKYTIGPGMDFSQPITLTLRYTPDVLPQGKEQSLSIVRWDGSAWRVVESWVNVQTHTLTTRVTSLGSFSVGYSNGRQSQPLPVKYALGQNYPNPFNPSTTISYILPGAGDVSLGIYDIRGSLVRSLFDGKKDMGDYSITWDAKDNQQKSVASGVYFYRITVKNGSDIKFVSTRKMLLIK
jgi:photosystem II stability/assembly factor-like uncharacterized protein